MEPPTRPAENVRRFLIVDMHTEIFRQTGTEKFRRRFKGKREPYKRSSGAEMFMKGMV